MHFIEKCLLYLFVYLKISYKTSLLSNLENKMTGTILVLHITYDAKAIAEILRHRFCFRMSCIIACSIFRSRFLTFSFMRRANKSKFLASQLCPYTFILKYSQKFQWDAPGAHLVDYSIWKQMNIFFSFNLSRTILP